MGLAATFVTSSKFLIRISSLNVAQRNPGQGVLDPGLHFISSGLQVVSEIMRFHQRIDLKYHFQLAQYQL